MSGLQGLHVAVAGAGALGCMIGWRLQTAGARVTLFDPAPIAANASGVAAGMLAPVFETLLDPAPVDAFPLLMTARDAWSPASGELARFGGKVSRSGSLWAGDEASQAETLGKLRTLGVEAHAVSAREAEAASAGLHAPQGAVFTPEDWRLDAGAMLGALQAAFAAAGGERRPEPLVRQEGDLVILATGLAPAGAAPRPQELAVLAPIKGQIVRFPGSGPRDGPAVRARGIYVAPAPGGAAAGATMEAGLADTHTDPKVAEALRERAAALYPKLAAAPVAAAAGVRSATPDGLPMVGPSSVPSVWLALGARRNGWLLAPLVAEVVAARLAGAATSWDAMLDPARFSSGPTGSE